MLNKERNLRVLNELVQSTAKNKTKLLFLIMPVTLCFQELFPKDVGCELRDVVSKLVADNQHVSFFDFYADSDFSSNDNFYDEQHLNKAGDVIMAKKIDNILDEMLNHCQR